MPGGVINILTGHRKELIPHFATHMDVNALVYCGNNSAEIKTIHEAAVGNLKRVVIRDSGSYVSDKYESPYLISSLQETKTTWHPVEKIGAAGSGY